MASSLHSIVGARYGMAPYLMKVVRVAMRRPMVCRWWRSSGAVMAAMRRRSAGTSTTGECCEGAGRGEPARQG